MTGIDALFAEAERQLTICNACRYCEGYCAVFPALELRRELAVGDLTYLANLCHGCRACYTACMYACVGSTAAAAILQDIASTPPPYALLSAPVLLGVLGGAGLVVGCTGLLLLKRRATRARDYGLLVALTVLAVTGLLALAFRDTAASGAILFVHLGAVVASFAIAPYTKFVHAVYRLLALVQHATEEAAK